MMREEEKDSSMRNLFEVNYKKGKEVEEEEDKEISGRRT
jgi:hypothetical protein